MEYIRTSIEILLNLRSDKPQPEPTQSGYDDEDDDTGLKFGTDFNPENRILPNDLFES
jgi:hypothetical protein